MEQIAQTRSLVDQAYDILLDAICVGEFRPGDRMNQDDIAARLNISRQPVNSAITMLKAQRFVQDTGRRGVVVSPVDIQQFRDIYEYRTAVEPLAAGLAAENFDQATERLSRRILDRGRKMVRLGDLQGVLAADVEFHSLIYKASGNLIVQDTMRLNWGHIRRSMVEVLRYPGATEQAWQEHEAILDALSRRDGALASARMQEHMIKAKDRILVLQSGTS